MSAAAPHIETELREAPLVVARQGDSLRAPLDELVARLARRPPSLVVTCARGSSAYAAGFAKHLFERCLGIPVAAAAPSIATVYRRRLALSDQLFLAISQSGVSDDLVETAAMARAAGALAVALVNATDSPLARVSDIVLPIAAGPERSIAATKSFVAALAALLRLTARWTGDDALQAAIMRLPDRLAAALRLDWSAPFDSFAAAASLIVIGRGPTLAVAREAALKLKEVANRHAEAFSGAEFLHGPISLVGPGYPILMLMPNDPAADGMRALAADLRRKGAAVFAAEPGAAGAGRLPALMPDQPECDAVCLALSFYAMIVRFARHLGIDPDRPRHLAKITRSR
jgi:glutamine---fructose-6-phosphate transaminase (isomerizing)